MCFLVKCAGFRSFMLFFILKIWCLLKIICIFAKKIYTRKINKVMKGYSRNNFKLSFEKERMEFIVNEVTGRITCVIYAKLLQPKCENSPIKLDDVSFIISARTTCTPNDTFDVERGKRIAMTKAENRLNMRALRWVRTQLKHISFMTTQMTKFDENLRKQVEHNFGYIERISNPKDLNYMKEVTPVKSGTTRYVL